MEAGESVSYKIARGPAYTEEGPTVLNWFWDGEDILLCMDFHEAYDGWVRLPEYMKNMRVETVDDGGLKVAGIVTEKGLKVSAQGYGYTVMRLK